MTAPTPDRLEAIREACIEDFNQTWAALSQEDREDYAATIQAVTYSTRYRHVKPLTLVAGGTHDGAPDQCHGEPC